MVRSLDREQRAEFLLTVVASDHGSPPRSATQLLTVSVADVNDEAPTFQQQEYTASSCVRTARLAHLCSLCGQPTQTWVRPGGMG